MDSKMQDGGAPDRDRSRVLVVADWAVDAEAVAAVCTARAEQEPQELGLLVPAWLHGLDWVGDPHGSRPCARRQLDRIGALAGARGVRFSTAAVGDPDVLTGVGDALAAWPADELLLCTRARRLVPAHPFGLAARARRLTGLRVTVASVASSGGAGWHGASIRRRTGHCGLDQAPAAAV